MTKPVSVELLPIPMLLYCPQCGFQHIDEPDERTPDWDNPPHKSHLCHGCGCIWRPADVPTEGVANIATRGKADTWGHRLAAERAAGGEETCAVCGNPNRSHFNHLAPFGEGYHDFQPTPDLRAENARLREALKNVRDNGLIYWERFTERGAIAKAQVLDCIDKALSTTPQPDERAEIVAWLREMAKASGRDHDISRPHLEWVADAIEAGDHRN